MFAALFNWRDGLARKEDESPGYVMSRATMIDVAKTMPTTRAKLHAVRNLSPLVTGSAEKLLRIISEAKKQAVRAPDALLPKKLSYIFISLFVS